MSFPLPVLLKTAVILPSCSVAFFKAFRAILISPHSMACSTMAFPQHPSACRLRLLVEFLSPLSVKRRTKRASFPFPAQCIAKHLKMWATRPASDLSILTSVWKKEYIGDLQCFFKRSKITMNHKLYADEKIYQVPLHSCPLQSHHPLHLRQ